MLLGLILSGCAASLTQPPAQLSAPIDDDRIVPGVRVGVVVLGMTAPELLRVRGDPDKVGRSDDGVEHRYYYGADMVVMVRGHVFAIDTAAPRYRTAEDLGVGSSELRVKTVYGSPCGSRVWPSGGYSYYYRGIAWGFDVRGSVQGFSVWQRGC